MKKFLSVTSSLLLIVMLSPALFAQNTPVVEYSPPRDSSQVISSGVGGDDVKILPVPSVDPYREEISRLRDLDLQAYAGEIAEELVKQIAWEKAWRELNKEFWGDTGLSTDFTVPGKEEVIATVYEMVQQLGGSAVPEAKVGIIADEIAGPVYAVIQALSLTDAQRQLVGMQKVEYLTQESIAINAIYQIKNDTFQKYMDILYPRPYPDPILYDLPVKSDGVK